MNQRAKRHKNTTSDNIKTLASFHLLVRLCARDIVRTVRRHLLEGGVWFGRNFLLRRY